MNAVTTVQACDKSQPDSHLTAQMGKLGLRERVGSRLYVKSIKMRILTPEPGFFFLDLDLALQEAGPGKGGVSTPHALKPW